MRNFDVAAPQNIRRDAFWSFQYHGYFIQGNVENVVSDEGEVIESREVIRVVDPETMASLTVKSIHAAKCRISRGLV